MLDGTVVVAFIGSAHCTCVAMRTNLPRAIVYAARKDENDFDPAQEDIVHDAHNRFYGNDAADVLHSLISEPILSQLGTSAPIWSWAPASARMALYCVPYRQLVTSLAGDDVFSTVPAPPAAPPGYEFEAPELVVTVSTVHPSGNEGQPFPLVTAAFGANGAAAKEMGVPRMFVPFSLDADQQEELIAAARRVFNGQTGDRTFATTGVLWPIVYFGMGCTPIPHIPK